MRDFGIIHTRFWIWAQEQNLTDTVKLLGAYLLTSPHGNSCGCFRQPISYTADDLAYSIDRVSKGYDCLIKNGFLSYCDNSKYILLRKYLKWNPIQNKNHGIGVIKYLLQIPSTCQLTDDIMDSIIKYGNAHLPYTVLDTLYHTLYKDQAIPCPYKGTYTETGKGTKIETIEYPLWLDTELWKGFKKHRTNINSPMTIHAEKLCLADLTKLIGEGEDQTAVINATIKSGKWKSFYADNSNGKPAKAKLLKRALMILKHDGQADYEIYCKDNGLDYERIAS